MLALDFSGCGRSQGEYISLGHYEQDDVKAAIRHLRDEGRTSLIALWGRSMGAVTALLYASKDCSVAGIVCDSPFSRLPDLMVELATSLTFNVAGYTMPAIPSTLAKTAVNVVRSSVKKKYIFDIDDVDAISAASNCYQPALFGHGIDDNFIEAHHSEVIADNYIGDCHVLKFKATHNSARPNSWYRNAATFMGRILNGGLKDTETLFSFEKTNTPISETNISDERVRETQIPISRNVKSPRNSSRVMTFEDSSSSNSEDDEDESSSTDNDDFDTDSE